jgi:putative flippase GtrA
MKIAKLNKIQFRYLICGVWNSVFGIAIFGILLWLVEDVVGYVAVLTISMPISIIQAHYVQRKFVWTTTSSYKKELLKFSMVYTVQYLLNVISLGVAVEILNFPVFYSQLVITSFLIVSSYLVNKKWTFSD